MTVRRAEAEDVATLAALARSVDPRWGTERLGQQLAREDSMLVVAERSGRTVGWLTARKTLDTWELWYVVVDPRSRRSGAGRALLEALISRAVAESAFVDAEVSEANTAALELYLSEGFQAVGRRPGYYPDGSDALLLRRPPPS